MSSTKATTFFNYPFLPDIFPSSSFSFWLLFVFFFIYILCYYISFLFLIFICLMFPSILSSSSVKLFEFSNLWNFSLFCSFCCSCLFISWERFSLACWGFTKFIEADLISLIYFILFTYAYCFLLITVAFSLGEENLVEP